MFDYDIDTLRRDGRDIRVHGNGFLQIDLPGHLRFHLFGHPGVPRQDAPTPVHDHAWGFTSNIICGTLVNIDYRFIEEREGATHVACHYEPSLAGGEDTTLVPSGVIGRLEQVRIEALRAGQNYMVDPWNFHETLATEPTITIMVKRRKHPTGLRPRVLTRIGIEPDNRFNRYCIPRTSMWEVVEDALRYVRRAEDDIR